MIQRLLIVSDSPAMFSGQARVVRELAGRFHQAGVEVAVAGWFHLMISEGPTLPYRIFPSWKDKPELVGPILDAYQPDTVLAIGDPWDFRWLADRRAVDPSFTLAGYLNVEAAPIPPNYETILDAFDVLTTTSEYGASVVDRPYVQAIHHGVDMKTFHPMPKPETFLGWTLKDTFVVLLNGQNIQRKNLTVALQGFARFAQGRSDVLCYANTVAEPLGDMAPGQNLKAVVMQLGIQDKIIFNPENRGPLDTLDDRHVNEMYSMADVLLMPSVAEGFGLPVLEALATNTVPAVTDGFSMPELVGAREERGILIPVAARVRASQGTDLALVSEEAVAVALNSLYASWRDGTLARYHRQGISFAIGRPWRRTYERLCDAMTTPRARDRAAVGQEIDPYLRMKAKAAARHHPGAIGVLKLGGLGDMLKAATVVRAAARKYAAPVVVFCNSHPEVFRPMPEVAEVVPIQDNLQDTIVRSVADEFPRFLDIRYVSKVYGDEPTEFFTKHQWMYRHWASSCTRLADLKRHALTIMLESLGLLEYADTWPDLWSHPASAEGLEQVILGGRAYARPTFDGRDGGPALEQPYVAVATGVGSLGPIKVSLKAWPEESWQALARACKAHGIHLVQVGGIDDPEVPEALDRRNESLDRTASILQHAVCVVAVEGGMAHLAAAVGTKSLVIFGPTPKAVFGYPGNINLGTDACTPCWWSQPGWYTQMCSIAAESCVNFPTPDVVAHHLVEIWAQHGAGKPREAVSV